MKLFNHWLYEMELEAKRRELQEKRRNTTEPYEQYAINEQIVLLDNLHKIYKETVNKQL